MLRQRFENLKHILIPEEERPHLCWEVIENAELVHSVDESVRYLIISLGFSAFLEICLFMGIRIGLE